MASHRRSTESAAIEYEPALIEESVRSALDRGAPGIAFLKLRRLRFDSERRLDRIYAQPYGENREAAFRQHFSMIFRELGLDSRVPRLLEPFPRLRTHLECILVRSADGGSEPRAELWESRDRRGQGVPSYLLITLSACGLPAFRELAASLLPDLQRAADVLDPEFGSRREDLACGAPGAQERLRSTYEHLWGLSARRRLQRRGLIDDPDLLDQIRILDARCRALGGDACSAPVVLSALLEASPRHDRLLDLARLLSGAEAGTTGMAATRCPLCRFPTTAWAGGESLAGVAAAIEADFPGWSPRDGCCGHCAERYALA